MRLSECEIFCRADGTVDLGLPCGTILKNVNVHQKEYSNTDNNSIYIEYHGVEELSETYYSTLDEENVIRSVNFRKNKK